MWEHLHSMRYCSVVIYLYSFLAEYPILVFWCSGIQVTSQKFGTYVEGCT